MKGRLAGLMIAALIGLSGCEAQPFSADQQERLKRVFADMPERKRIAIEQNLRFSGTYTHELTGKWSPDLEKAINQVHFELDMLANEYALDTDGNASKFLSELASPEVRVRFANELVADLPELKRTVAPSRDAELTDWGCRIAGGVYSRNGETVSPTFYLSRDGILIEIDWNGWPGGVVFGPLIALEFGKQGWPMNITSSEADAVTQLKVMNDNGFILLNMMKEADSITLEQR